MSSRGLSGAARGSLGGPWALLGRLRMLSGEPWGAQGSPKEPFWSHSGVILESFSSQKSIHFRDKFLDDILHALGFDLGSIWEPKWSHF